MKKLAAIVATALCSVTLAMPAAPVQAQSFSFGFGVDSGPRFHDRWDRWDRGDRWDRWDRWDRPRFRPRARSGISIDLGPVDVRVRVPRSHILRCEARYRSYDRFTDTYLGFDGDRHRCRL